MSYPKHIDDELAMQMYRDGKSDGEIAYRFGVHRSSVWYWRKQRGLSANAHSNGPENLLPGWRFRRG